MRLAAAMFAALLAMVGTTVPVNAARTTLRLTMQLPIKSVLGRSVVRFKDEVEKATAGGIEVQIFDSGQLFDERDVPTAVSGGAIEMGVVSLASYASEVPAVEVFHIPFLFDSDAKLRAAVAPNSPVRMPLDAAIARTGVRVLAWNAYGGTVLLTRGGPLRQPGDLKGRRVRIVTSLLGKWVEAVRGIPLNIAGSDQYFAYQRGTVEVGMTSPAQIKARKLWEVMDTITVANVSAAEYIVVINTAAFAALSDAEQAIVQAAARSAEVALRNDMTQIEKEAIEAGRLNNMKVHALDAAETLAFRKSAEGVRDAFLLGGGALGTQVYEAAVALK